MPTLDGSPQRVYSCCTRERNALASAAQKVARWCTSECVPCSSAGKCASAEHQAVRNQFGTLNWLLFEWEEARLGGDEFVVLAAGCTAEQATALGRHLVEAIGVPHDLGCGARARVGVSVGSAMAPGHGNRAADLLRAAKRATSEPLPSEDAADDRDVDERRERLDRERRERRRRDVRDLAPQRRRRAKPPVARQRPARR